MTGLPPVDFSRIRAYGGAQHRAFEELAYLLAWDLERLDRGTDLERRGTPDGGVEFSCLPEGVGNGGRWAWQAKYVFRFDASAFKQMTESVVSALKSTPDLEKFIFVVPKDRSTAALRKWKEHVSRWEAAAAKRKMTVEFQIRGESDLVRALTKDRHAGAIRYFFDDRFLTQESFKKQVARSVADLGQRYDPRVNVETEARRIVDAACRAPQFVHELASLVAAVAAKAPFVDRSSDIVEPLVSDGVAHVRALLDQWRADARPLLDRLSEPGDSVFTRLEGLAHQLATEVMSQVDGARDRVNDLDELSRRAERRRRPTTKTPPRRKTRAQRAEDERDRRRDLLHRFTSEMYNLRNEIDGLLAYLKGDQVAAASGGAVVLTGEAGCGKSHLVADVASERVDANLPSFLVLGQVLVRGAVDPQIVSTLGLGSMTLADALQALDVAARVRRSGRALLVIDAINEGAGADLWADQLRGFIEAVSRYPWIALVITVRDVYENAVAPDGVGQAVKSIHHGLAGHEEEALTLYADLYGLRLPDVPALLPELSNPLFLRSLCQSVQGRGLTEIPREAASLVWVFDGLIAAVDVTLRQPSRLDYADWEKKAAKAARALATLMVDRGSEALPLPDAADVCQAIHDATRHSQSLLNGLIIEGLLLRERRSIDGTPTEVVRFTYQRLSDHLRAEVLLERNSSDRALAATLGAISHSDQRWAMSGVIGALTLLVPERRGKELATVLRLGTKVTPDLYRWPQDPRGWLRFQVERALVETLMWRSPSAFGPETKKLLNRYLDAGLVEPAAWLRIVTGLACVPGHPLNVAWLDDVLRRMAMPDRDEVWSWPLLDLYSEDMNPIDRTVDWLWANPEAPDDVAQLATVFLCWLFTSPNRRLRDTATKALVALTANKPRLVAQMVERFADVNDPYVLDRVIAAAYGHVLRCRHESLPPQDLVAVMRLGQGVFDAVFGGEPPAHLMIRHRARSCVRIIDSLCRAGGLDFKRDLTRADPPYSSDWPLRAPTAKQLAKGFGREYKRYLGSATELDWEFERDLERGVLDDLALPGQTRLRNARRRKLIGEVEDARRALVDAAPPSQKPRVRKRAELLIDTYRTAFDHTRWRAFEDSLSKAARTEAEHLRSAVHELDRLDTRIFRPSSELCTRWVAARVLDLGWTKERFGAGDRVLARWPGEHATERVAKKYERIAFQELCGRLSDHCLIHDSWRDTAEPYRGPWQLTQTLDVDPSLLVRGDEPESDTSAARLRAIRLRREEAPAWWRTHADHCLSAEGTNESWLSEVSDIPRPEAMLQIRDPKGREWIALERHQEWTLMDELDLRDRYERNRRTLWFMSQANIIRADDAAHAPWAADKNWMGLSALSTPQDVWIANFGEYPDIPPWPEVLDLGDEERRPYEDDPGPSVLPPGWEFAQINSKFRAPYSIATVWCHRESGRDFAAADSPNPILPSRMLLDILGAQWSGGHVVSQSLGLGPVEREYSWVAGGEVVAFSSAARGFSGPRTLWVSAEPLRLALERANLAMWCWTLGEKIYWHDLEPSSNRADCFAGVRVAPGPLDVWGYTVEFDTRGNRPRRVLVERSPELAPQRAK